MPGTREYVSLPARLRQASQARADMRERLQGSRSRTVTVTDEQLADQAYLDGVTRGFTDQANWYDAGQWRELTTAFTNITTAAGTAAMTINAAMNRFIPTGALTATMGVYNPITYTTQFTYSSQDAVYWENWNTQYTETEEARAAREAAAAEMAVRQREHRERILAQAVVEETATAAAEQVARELLMAHLDAQQKRDALEHGWFEVLSDKGRRWRIRLSGYTGNVDLMPEEGEERLASYCAHGSDQMPRSDHHLAQKLVLETDDDDFLDVANLHYRGELPPGVTLPRRRTPRAYEYGAA